MKELYMEDVISLAVELGDIIDEKFEMEISDEQYDELRNLLEKIANYPDYKHHH